MSSALTKGLVAAQIAETFATYASADLPLTKHEIIRSRVPRLEDGPAVMDDEMFWKSVLGDGAGALGIWYFFEVAISEWVPRIPGLFWTRGSKAMRTINPSLIEHQTREWVTYTPLRKSQKVS